MDKDRLSLEDLIEPYHNLDSSSSTAAMSEGNIIASSIQTDGGRHISDAPLLGLASNVDLGLSQQDIPTKGGMLPGTITSGDTKKIPVESPPSTTTQLLKTLKTQQSELESEITLPYEDERMKNEVKEIKDVFSNIEAGEGESILPKIFPAKPTQVQPEAVTTAESEKAARMIFGVDFARLLRPSPLEDTVGPEEAHPLSTEDTSRPPWAPFERETTIPQDMKKLIDALSGGAQPASAEERTRTVFSALGVSLPEGLTEENVRAISKQALESRIPLQSALEMSSPPTTAGAATTEGSLLSPAISPHGAGGLVLDAATSAEVVSKMEASGIGPVMSEKKARNIVKEMMDEESKANEFKLRDMMRRIAREEDEELKRKLLS